MSNQKYEDMITDVSSTVIVIIPAYNEGKSIFHVASSIKQEYPLYHIVVIDDGSDDETYLQAKKAGVTVLRHPYNMGYGLALQTGYKYAFINNYMYLVQLDGDGQHDIKYIKQLLENVTNGSCDLALGSRFLCKDSFRPSFLRFITASFVGQKQKVDNSSDTILLISSGIFRLNDLNPDST